VSQQDNVALGQEDIQAAQRLTQAYKTLLQNVPEPRRTVELYDVLGYLRALPGRVDDSLVTEWEKLASRGAEVVTVDRQFDISADEKAFRARVRAEMHALVRALSREDWEEAAGCVRSEWDFQTALAPFVEEFGNVASDHRARFATNTTIKQVAPHRWQVRQVLSAGEEDETGWAVEGTIDLTADTNPDGPLLEVEAVGG
jgi:hypothetical protein